MPNQTTSIWRKRPELAPFIIKLRVEEDLTHDEIIARVKKEHNVKLTHDQVGKKLRGVQRKEPEIAVRALNEGDPLKDKLRKLLLKGPATPVEIANKLDVSPKRVEKMVSELHANGYNVAVHEEQGAEARLMMETDRVPVKKELRINAQKFYEDTYRFDFGAVSDTHLGSKFYRPEVLHAIYDNFAQHGIKHVFHGGNYIEGEKHDKVNLLVHGMQGQIDYFIKEYPQREGMTTYFVAGDDHEGWYQQREGIDIGRFTQTEAESQGRHDLINLGYMEADVAIPLPGGAKCKVRVVHAGGGSSYATSYAPQKVIESMEGGEKPQILLIGHYHKSLYMPAYRNVHTILMGTTKSQDVFMRKLRLAAHVGGWRCSAVIGKDGAVREFSATYLPFFNQGYYESMAIDPKNQEVTYHGANETYNVVH